MPLDLRLETETQEFKASLGEMDKGIEALTAMLNKHCIGNVYYGVSDRGEILGLNGQIGKETIKKVCTRVAEIVKPALLPEVSYEQIDGKFVLHLSASGNKRPYSCNGNYRIRVGSENKQIDPELLGEIFYSSESASIDAIEAMNQDLSFQQLKGLYAAQGLTIQNENFEKNIGLQHDGKYNMLAELLADNSSVSIKVVRFAGKDKLDMISRNEYGNQCLLIAMKNASDYVKSLNETRVDINTDIIRKEMKLFDSHSFEEAWTNACLHNKWIKNVPPAIYIYDDRIEIISTGGLPFDYTKENFYSGLSHPVNPGLMRIMVQLGLVEQTGHGNLVVIAHYGREAFDIAQNHIQVTIPFAFHPTMVHAMPERLTISQSKVFNAIKDHPTYTREQLSAICGLGTTRLGEIINELKKLNMITRVGSNKSGYWKMAAEKTGDDR